jgi:pilus assembly protein CpaD
MMKTANEIRRSAAWLAPLALAATLAACQPSGEKLGTLTGPMPEAPPQVVVRDQTHHLAVRLPDSGPIGSVDWYRIDHFLGDAAHGRPENVRLTIAGNASPGMIDLVIRHAFAFGYADNKIVVAPPTAGGRYRLTLDLTARTSVAILPNCPQTTHLNLIDRDNRVSSDWGCSSISNLEIQVADPHDLVRGQSGGETDSVMTTAAIQRMQTDKLKKLDAVSSMSTGGGGSQ